MTFSSNVPGWATGWTRQGIRWREMSAAEIVWMVHSDILRNMISDSPSKVRAYLLETGDVQNLQWWDSRSTTESGLAT